MNELLTTKEKVFLSNLKPIMTPDTRVLKVRSFGGVTEYIKLIDVKSVLKDRENVDLPTFKTNSMYAGLTPGMEYTLDALGISIGD